jgi:hypothetical protein
MASVTLTWNAPDAGAAPTSYKLYKLASATQGTEDEDAVVSGGTSVTITPTVGQTVFSYTDNSVSSSSPGPYYSYTVVAVNDGGESSPHDPAVIADLS